MGIVDNSIVWVLTGDNPIMGHWEDIHGKEVKPIVGMSLDPSICDLHWKAALNVLGLDALPIPGDIVYHVTNLKSTASSLPRIKGY